MKIRFSSLCGWGQKGWNEKQKVEEERKRERDIEDERDREDVRKDKRHRELQKYKE